MVARWAARSRWYWAKTQQEMYMGRSTKRPATGPWPLRHRTPIISPARPCTRCGASARPRSPRQAARGGGPSTVARMPPSRAVRTRQRARAAAPAGSSAYGRSGASRSFPRAAGPPRAPAAWAAAQTARAVAAARQARRGAAGGSSTRARRLPGTAASAAAAGGRSSAAARRTGKKEPVPRGTEPPSARPGRGQRAGSSQSAYRAARSAIVPQGAPGRSAGRTHAPAASRAQPMYARAAGGMVFTPIIPVTLASRAARDGAPGAIRTFG